jgi:(2Fe-2S) ferredoxin
METGNLPYETLVLVCTNKRGPDERAGCASHGRCGAELRDKLKEAVAQKGLKGKVRVSASGCLDVCEEGPNVVVSPASGGKTWLKKVSVADVPMILERIAKGG